MLHFKNTRDVVTHALTYISGNTIDYGAGNAKYRKLIEPRTTHYTTFDMIPSPSIDVVGDALKPPFPDATFDTVISTQMLEHVSEPWKVVSEMKRILKPGGICIVTAPFLVPYHADPHDYFRYTKEGMASLFRNEGFTILECVGYGNTPSVLAEMVHFAHFSHYTKRSKMRQRMRNTIMNLIKKIAAMTDRTFQNPAVYANVYVVAKKS